MSRRQAENKRTFLHRRGRATRAQRRALHTHWRGFGLDLRHGQPLVLTEAYGRRAPLWLEVGFGMGECLLAVAAAHPDRNVLGIEVHRPGLGALVAGAAALGLSNLRVIRGDATAVLATHLPASVVDDLCVFFPDPWPRVNDRERRIIRPRFVRSAARVLKPGGRLHLATDIADYAHLMVDTLAQDSRFVLDAPVFAPRPAFRPLTRYESKGRDQGRPAFDLRYRLARGAEASSAPA